MTGPSDRSLNKVRSRIIPGYPLLQASGLARQLALCDRLQRLAESAFAAEGIEAQLKHWVYGLSEASRSRAALVLLGARELHVGAFMGPVATEQGAVWPHQGIAAQALRDRDLVLGAAVEVDPTTPVALRDTLSVGLPLVWNGRTLGVALFWLPALTSPETEILLLRMAASSLGQHLDSAENRARDRHRSARFELIAQAAQLVGSDADQQVLLQRTADAIHTLLGYPAVDIPTIDRDDPAHLTIRVRGGHYKHLIRQVDKVPIGHGIMGAAASERRTQCVNDVAGDSRYINPPGVDPPQAELAVPVLVDGMPVAVINVEGPRRFSPLDVTTIEAVAHSLALALEAAERVSRARSGSTLQVREDIAKDVETTLTQLLTNIHMLADTLEVAMRTDVDKAMARCQRLRELTHAAQRESRALVRRSLGEQGDRPKVRSDG